MSDKDLDDALTQLTKDAGTLTPVDREVQIGDTPTIDYLGKIDDVPFDGGSAQNQATEIIEDRFIPGFASGIVGMKAGETKDIETKFPDDYQSTELAGKTAIFTITVHENKVSEPVALDDELAKKFKGPDATLDELKDDLRNRLEANARERRKRAVSGPLLDKILAGHDVPLPEVMVKAEADGLENEAKGYIERAGIGVEQISRGSEEDRGRAPGRVPHRSREAREDEPRTRSDCQGRAHQRDRRRYRSRSAKPLAPIPAAP